MLQEIVDERIELIKLIDFMYSVNEKQGGKAAFLTLYEIQREQPEVSQKALGTAVMDGYIKKISRFGDTYYGISEKGVLLVEENRK